MGRVAALRVHFLLVLPLFVALLFAAPPVQAQDAEAPALPPPADAIRFKVVVDAPQPPRAALEEGLDLVRWQADDGMTLDLLELLARDAAAQAREIAAVQGYFNAEAEVAIDRQAEPVVVTVKLRPGTPARVRTANVEVTGPAATDAPLGTDAIRAARDGWSLPLGAIFRQAAWIDAKSRALRALQRSPYAAARIAHSEARIDPHSDTADLEVAIDSGPLYRFGGVTVQGLKRYESSVVANFNVIRPGDPHSQEALDQYVRRLSASGYFSSVQAAIDTAANPDDATINVSVIEGPTHRLEGAISYSTDTGFGARGSYTNVNLDGDALQMRLEGRLETKVQLLRSVFTAPPTASGWLDAYTIGAERSDIENTIESNAGVQYERRGVDERNTPVWTLAYTYDRQEPQGLPTTSAYATFVQGGYVLRRVDDLLSPTRGYMVDGRLGGGIPGLSSDGFLRAYVQAAAWWPIDRMTELALRGEFGAVLAKDDASVPAVYRFRTGGDTTVRGYAYQSLGVDTGSGAVVGGRYLVVASAEIIRWINETWGIAAFIDAGNAADDLSGLDPAVGVGLGARLRTPIGPFRLDVAYGERTNSVRLHFSVGVSF